MSLIYVLALLIPFETNGQLGDLGDSLIRQANKYYQIQDYKNAILFERRAAQYFNSINDYEKQSNCLNDVGLYFYLSGRYESSLFYYEKALQTDINLQDSGRILRRYKNIGIVYKKTGRYEQALQYYLQAAEIGWQIGDTIQIGKLSNEIGIIFNEQDKPREALPYFHHAITIFQSQGDSLGHTRALNNLGAVYFEMNEIDSAIFYFAKTLEIKQQSKKFGSAGVALQNIGRSYLALDQYDSAAYYLQAALTYKLENDNAQSIALTANNLARLYLQQSQFDVANQFLTISEEYLSKTTSRNVLAEYLLLKSQLLDSLKQPVRAYEFYRKWNLLQDSLFQTERVQVLDQLNTYEKELIISEKELTEKDLLLAQQENEQSALRSQFQWVVIIFISMGVLLVSILALRIRKQRNHIEFLLRGFHHGIKNHLQIISALLEAQADISDQAISQSLREAQIRIEAVIGIYRRLYLKNEFSYIDQQEYLEELVDNSALVFGKRHVLQKRVISLVRDMDAETSIMMGLIINEVLTNAFKYGLQNIEQPSIEIDLHKTDTKYALYIADNSQTPRAPEISGKSFGMQLIQSLSGTLKAVYQFKVNNGLHFYLNFHQLEKQ